MEDAFCRSAKHFADHMHTIRRYCVLCGGAGGGKVCCCGPSLSFGPTPSRFDP
jgi:hypothetical protein